MSALTYVTIYTSSREAPPKIAQALNDNAAITTNEQGIERYRTFTVAEHNGTAHWVIGEANYCHESILRDVVRQAVQDPGWPSYFNAVVMTLEMELASTIQTWGLDHAGEWRSLGWVTKEWLDAGPDPACRQP